MAHHNIDLKKFIDSVPEPMFAEYFKQKINGQIPAIQKYDHASITSALDVADARLRNRIIEDFSQINEVCESAMNILVQSAQRYRVQMTGDEKREELAMKLFLFHRAAFDRAQDFYYLLSSSIKMSQHQIAAENFTISEQKVERFRELVRDFYAKSAKGKECKVRYYDDPDKIVMFIIHGSYTRSVVVWDAEETKTISFRRVSEDILHYDKVTSLLLIKAPYQKDRDNYIAAFTEAIVEDGSQAHRADRDMTYTLESLQNGKFSFAGNDDIRAITLLEVKIETDYETVILRSDDILETIKRGKLAIKLTDGDLVHAKFRFRLMVDGKPRRVTFEIDPPNVTNLNKKKYADIIAKYLKENGVKLI